MAAKNIWFLLIVLTLSYATQMRTYESLSLPTEKGLDVKKKQVFGGPRLCEPSDVPYSFNPNAQNGPPNWGQISYCCDGALQSPISLFRQSASCGTVSGFPQYTSILSMPGNLYNDGKVPTLQFAGRQLSIVNVPGGAHFTDRYVLDHIHIHLGNARQPGGEHTINGRNFHGEVHLVHYRDVYRSLAEAMSKPDALVVIGMVLDLASNTNMVNMPLWNLTMGLSQLRGIGPQYGRMHVMNPNWLIPLRRDFYTYQGSLTTPPCSENVRWIVLEEPLYITQEMLNIYWNLPSKDGGRISDYTNVRPLTPVNNRVIQTNFFCIG